tara:strand:+ start:142 stop:381 length:240 start_codon:yes stop_codon:yes gene_type:complete
MATRPISVKPEAVARLLAEVQAFCTREISMADLRGLIAKALADAERGRLPAMELPAGWAVEPKATPLFVLIEETDLEDY